MGGRIGRGAVIVMNWAEFFAMKGYGFYVWGSYGMTLLVVMVEVLLVRQKRKNTLRQCQLMRQSGVEE